MSIAGRRSNRGDEFQVQVALRWVLALLEHESPIDFVVVDAVALPYDPRPVLVDDVVIRFKDGKHLFVQAKKNQKAHRAWSLNDLGHELRRAIEQLERDPRGEVQFCSGTPFGDLSALAEGCGHCPTFEAFKSEPHEGLRDPLARLAALVQRTEEQAFQAVQRFQFDCANLDKIQQGNRSQLRGLATNVDAAHDALVALIREHQSSRRDAPTKISKNDAIDALAKRGVRLIPSVSRSEAAGAFARASLIGRRSRIRTIGEHKIRRPELEDLCSWVEKTEKKTILVKEGPGSGKTCLLLDLADEIESNPNLTLLFIQCEEFAACESESDLEAAGLPADIVGTAALLACEQRVVVILDSLDVLSLYREHGSLRLFLNVLDQLQRIPNVVVVAACRKFDLEFDPRLQGRTWPHTLVLRALDFEQTVRPILEDVGIRADRLSEELRGLATVPNNLRLLVDLGPGRLGGEAVDIRSAHQLHSRYLEEVVANEPRLGLAAMSVLEALASRMLAKRELRVPKVAVASSPAVLQRLISQNVLVTVRGDYLQFAHQSMLDAVAVRSALAKGQDLREFILSHPPVPFVRPAVRGFVGHLRASDPSAFERQVRSALEEPMIAHHLKSTIVDSLADLGPTSHDRPLVSFLWRRHRELFRRLLVRVDAESWFPVLHRHWWPMLEPSRSDVELRVEFLSTIGKWLNTHQPEVLDLWREALSSPWAPPHLTWRIAAALEGCARWEDEKVLDIVKALLTRDQDEVGCSGSVISRFIDATATGDELLWQYITARVGPEVSLAALERLRCERHHFHRGEFLRERLKISDPLLDLAVAWVEKVDGGVHLLRATTWAAAHTRGVERRSEAATLLRAVEEAVVCRAAAADTWWQANEPALRRTKSTALRYVMLRAYCEMPNTNANGVAAQLLDRELLCSHDLRFEVTELVRRCFSIVPAWIQESHQELVLAIAAEQDERGERKRLRTCDLLQSVPAPFRLERGDRYLRRWAPDGHRVSRPHVYSTAGWVKPPLSSEDLLSVSSTDLLRVIQFYARDPEGSWTDHTGGLDELCTQLAEAASRAPIRLLSLVDDLVRGPAHPSAVRAIVRGGGRYLRYQHGNLQRPHPEAPQEDADPETVAAKLLAILESHVFVWHDLSAISEVVRGCADVVERMGDVERLVSLLARALAADGAAAGTAGNDSERDVMDLAVNEPSGVVSGAAAALAARLLEAGTPLPAELRWFLRRLAAHPATWVCAALLDRLPFILQEDRELGWALLDAVHAGRDPRLWEPTEECLAPRLRDSFRRVGPFLDRMMEDAPMEAGEAWGRLSMLSVLNGSMPFETVLSTLKRNGTEATWNGVVQVLVANAGDYETASTCRSALVRVLRDRTLSLPDSVISIVDGAMMRAGEANELGLEVVEAFVNALPPTAPMPKLGGLVRVLPWAARHDVFRALPIMETVAGRLTRDSARALHDDKSIPSALLELQREADLSNDAFLMDRVAAVQDHLLRIECPGVERLFDEAVERRV